MFWIIKIHKKNIISRAEIEEKENKNQLLNDDDSNDNEHIQLINLNNSLGYERD